MAGDIPPELDRALSGDTIAPISQKQPEPPGRSKIESGFSPAWCLQPQVAFNVSEQFWLKNNFAETSSVDVLEANDGHRRWISGVDDELIEALIGRNKPHETVSRPRLLAFFVSLVTEGADAGTMYGNRANLSRQGAHRLIQSYGISDAFIPDLIGRPDYWAPYVVHDESEATYQFHCQHPRWQKPERWDQHRLVQRAPSSTYMKYFGSSNMTIYIVAAAPNDDCIVSLRQQLWKEEDHELRLCRLQSFASGHPFLLHNAISSIIVEQSKEAVHHVRKDLMAQINKVNGYSRPTDEQIAPNRREREWFRRPSQAEPSRESRSELEDITKEFHLVSQMADTGIANAQKAIENCEYIRDQYATFQSHFPALIRDHVVESSMRYSLNVWICQKRLLVSYKARKETSMNLVFNLVTQQDSAANVKIAYSMLQDSSSMKVIAVLTMLFLPGAFVAALFSSGIFITDASGSSQRTDLLLPLVYSIIPLTLLTVSLWATRGTMRKMAIAIMTWASTPWACNMHKTKDQDVELGLTAGG